MKRFPLMVVALIPMLWSTAQAQTNQISNTLHDFSSFSWSGFEICKPCHVPHNAIAGSISPAIWNHTLSNATYKLANGVSGTGADVLDSGSRLCLSCHDGTVALDNFGGSAMPQQLWSYIPSRYKKGPDLTPDHPVGKNAVLTDEIPGFKPVNYATGKIGTLPLYDNGHAPRVVGPGDTRKNLVVSCVSCHDAHGQGVDGPDSPKLLRVSIKQSKLCFTCHDQ